MTTPPPPSGAPPPAAAPSADDAQAALEALMNKEPDGGLVKKKAKGGRSLKKGLYHQGLHLAARLGLAVKVAQMAEIRPGGISDPRLMKGVKKGAKKGAKRPMMRPKAKAKGKGKGKNAKGEPEDDQPINPANPNEKFELPILLANTILHKRDVDGWTPLHHACFNGQNIVVRLLLENGHNPNMKTAKYKHTPLHLCVLGSVPRPVETLELYPPPVPEPTMATSPSKAVLNASPSKAVLGSSPSKAALSSSSSSKGALASSSASATATAAAPAAATTESEVERLKKVLPKPVNTYLECVRLLLEYGAMPSMKNKKKKTPVDLATGELRSYLLTANLKIIVARRYMKQMSSAKAERGGPKKKLF
eukprot:gnl/Spiro4/15663_TR8418_c0_g1_i1.p1 gnl/Spiro4/15663_TR8418_c0_g1~~gnl/Spiro4/15663_TR8418_c0_g1_i1.p1  ORF type:complete len:363 (+),score=106.15 gnl/Spiro4/15663_TR8418_c0_g1_i1:84-1172(+)